jgi:hypothetical protein
MFWLFFVIQVAEKNLEQSIISASQIGFMLSAFKTQPESIGGIVGGAIAGGSSSNV